MNIKEIRGITYAFKVFKLQASSSMPETIQIAGIHGLPTRPPSVPVTAFALLQPLPSTGRRRKRGELNVAIGRAEVWKMVVRIDWKSGRTERKKMEGKREKKKRELEVDNRWGENYALVPKVYYLYELK